jgi:hypothetical protein
MAEKNPDGAEVAGRPVDARLRIENTLALMNTCCLTKDIFAASRTAGFGGIGHCGKRRRLAVLSQLLPYVLRSKYLNLRPVLVGAIQAGNGDIIRGYRRSPDSFARATV